MKNKRILLKLSGEALQGQKEYGIDDAVIMQISREIREIQRLGAEVGIVIGGGNIVRGLSVMEKTGMDRAAADNMGMLATTINSLALQSGIERAGGKCEVMTSVFMPKIAPLFNKRQAVNFLKKKKAVIFAGGTGNPFFTTDTAAALKAAEIEADILFKATKVDGVYSADPLKDKKAVKYTKISYADVIAQNLKVMDITAITICMENFIQVNVFNMLKKGNIKKAILGKDTGTVIKSK